MLMADPLCIYYVISNPPIAISIAKIHRYFHPRHMMNNAFALVMALFRLFQAADKSRPLLQPVQKYRDHLRVSQSQSDVKMGEINVRQDMVIHVPLNSPFPVEAVNACPSCSRKKFMIGYMLCTILHDTVFLEREGNVEVRQQ